VKTEASFVDVFWKNRYDEKQWEGEKTMIQPIIEFCISNLASGSQKALEILEKDPNLDIIEYSCLSYCTRCAETLFALVNGEIVTGDTPEQLVENIYRYLEENPMFWAIALCEFPIGFHEALFEIGVSIVT